MPPSQTIRDLLGYGSDGSEDDTLSSVLSNLSALNVACMAEIVLYGVHVVLFAICIFCIFRNQPSKQKVFLLAIICMFGLSTADIAFSFRVMITDFRLLFNGRKDILIAHVYPKSPIFVSNNFIADMLLLYRCYMIWNRNIYIALSSSILLIADTVWGWLGAGSPIFTLANRFAPVFYWTVFATNIVMTVATAGRIYWIVHQSFPVLGQESVRKYHVAIAILVESGLVYSCCLLSLVLTFGNPNLRIIFACITIRVVAIMPTLMIVQVQLGRSVDYFTRKDEDLEMSNTKHRVNTAVRLETIIITARDGLSLESDIRHSEPGSATESAHPVSVAPWKSESVAETEENKHSSMRSEVDRGNDEVAQ